MLRKCNNCSVNLVSKEKIKYCSNKCQHDSYYKNHILIWKNNSQDKRFATKNISAHLKRYLLEKYNNKCSQCGWNKINPISGKIPLEVDHIDGNAENNSEINLRLLCPNCHSLTPYFRNLNRGKGRKWRMGKI